METVNDLLNNYKTYPDTSECYLDGRYYSLVLAPLYQGVIPAPVHVTFSKRKDKVYCYVKMKNYHPLQSTGLNFIRVIIQSNRLKLSALLIVDVGNHKAWFWNP